MIFYGWQSLKDRVLMDNGLQRKKGVVCKKPASIRGFHKGKMQGSESLSGDDSDGSFTPKKSKKIQGRCSARTNVGFYWWKKTAE